MQWLLDCCRESFRSARRYANEYLQLVSSPPPNEWHTRTDKVPDKVQSVDINLEQKLVKVATNLPKEEIMEALKKTGKEVKSIE